MPMRVEVNEGLRNAFRDMETEATEDEEEKCFAVARPRGLRGHLQRGRTGLGNISVLEISFLVFRKKRLIDSLFVGVHGGE